MNKQQLGEISEKIIEILGLEIEDNKNLLFIRDEDGEVIEEIDFTDEVIELTQYIDDNFIKTN